MMKLSALRSLPGLDVTPGGILPRELPDTGHYVYFLWLDGRLMYAGRTRALRNRIAAHSGKHFDRVTWHQCADAADARVMEYNIIRQLRPPLNQRNAPDPANPWCHGWREAPLSCVVVVNMTEQAVAQLQARADVEGRTRAEMVRHAVNAYMETPSPVHQRPRRTVAGRR